MGETKGIGLGLSTSRILCEAQDGKIQVESEKGVFTRVTLTIGVESKAEDKLPLAENFFASMKKRETKEEKRHKKSSKNVSKSTSKSKLKNRFGGEVSNKYEKVPLLPSY